MFDDHMALLSTGTQRWWHTHAGRGPPSSRQWLLVRTSSTIHELTTGEFLAREMVSNRQPKAEGSSSFNRPGSPLCGLRGEGVFLQPKAENPLDLPGSTRSTMSLGRKPSVDSPKPSASSS